MARDRAGSPQTRGARGRLLRRAARLCRRRALGDVVAQRDALQRRTRVPRTRARGIGRRHRRRPHPSVPSALPDPGRRGARRRHRLGDRRGAGRHRGRDRSGRLPLPVPARRLRRTRGLDRRRTRGRAEPRRRVLLGHPERRSLSRPLRWPACTSAGARGRVARSATRSAAGLASGLAYLARPEGLGLACVLVVLALFEGLRGTWRLGHAFRWAASVGVAALLCVAPYAIALRRTPASGRSPRRSRSPRSSGVVPGTSPRRRPQRRTPLPLYAPVPASVAAGRLQLDRGEGGLVGRAGRHPAEARCSPPRACCCERSARRFATARCVLFVFGRLLRARATVARVRSTSLRSPGRTPSCSSGSPISRAT